MTEIERLQDNLLIIRRMLGWRAEELGNRIGVTRQTINNLEFKRNKLTKTQYIAIRAILDKEIANFPDDTRALVYLLDFFVDNPEKYKEEDRKRFISRANMVTPSVLTGVSSRKDVSDDLSNFVTSLGLISGFAYLAGAWLVKLLKDK